jgi:hypothetical protein
MEVVEFIDGAGARPGCLLAGTDACSDDDPCLALAVLGYAVTVFEALPDTGGMLRYGIPEYRLPRGVIDREVSIIERLGATIETGMKIDEKRGLRELRDEGFEACFISVGASRGRDLQIPGVDKDGVIKAVDYLLNLNRGADVCSEKCLVFVPVDRVDMPEEQKQAALASYGHDPEKPMTVLLKDDTVCIRCGLCALLWTRVIWRCASLSVLPSVVVSPWSAHWTVTDTIAPVFMSTACSALSRRSAGASGDPTHAYTAPAAAPADAPAETPGVKMFHNGLSVINVRLQVIRTVRQTVGELGGR